MMREWTYTAQNRDVLVSTDSIPPSFWEGIHWEHRYILHNPFTQVLSHNVESSWDDCAFVCNQSPICITSQKGDSTPFGVFSIRLATTYLVSVYLYYVLLRELSVLVTFIWNLKGWFSGDKKWCCDPLNNEDDLDDLECVWKLHQPFAFLSRVICGASTTSSQMHLS